MIYYYLSWEIQLTNLGYREYIGALMVQLQICDRENQGTHTETEDPHQDDHPPAFTLTHDDRVPAIYFSQFSL